jgi:hypothetical protein
MASIVTAVETGDFVYVYGERNRVLCTIPSAGGPGDGLKGYTSSSVSIQQGRFIYVYNEKGQCIQTIGV